MSEKINAIELQNTIRDCVLCEDTLTAGVNPILQIHPDAKILIASQAPGRKAHASSIPFDDPSGERLRAWLGVDKQAFYNPKNFAILPMGFCYPGKAKTGDLPPKPICAQTWRAKSLASMPHIQLILVIGQYAIKYHTANRPKTLTQTVREGDSFGKAIFPLPHPSPLNNIWLKRNAWFEQERLPVLKNRVAALLKTHTNK